MKILLTADPELPVPPRGYGGIERIVDGLVRYLRSEGHEVGLAARRDSTAKADASFSWPGASSRSAWDTARNAIALSRAVKSFKPELLHSFSRLAYLGPLLPSRLPKVMSYQRHTGGRSVAAAVRLGRGTLRFTGCSEYLCRMGRRAGGDWRAIHNFIELGTIDFAPRPPENAPLLFLSRIESIKGASLAVAVARAAGRRLILAGNRAQSGPERDYWEREIAPALANGRVDYVGEVDNAQKNALLGNACGLIVPIQWDEPFGIVFAEALAAGTPVITCARGAAPEIVEDGATGFFIRSVEEGAAAVRRLSEIDRAGCRKAAERRFSLQVCGARYADLYREILSSRR